MHYLSRQYHERGIFTDRTQVSFWRIQNGSDPWSMFQTLDKGYGQMIPQPQYSIKDKYALIHYIREGLVKPNNPKQYFDVTEEYLASLPPKLSSFKETLLKQPTSGSRPYELMDFGPTLFWTYQVNEGKSLLEWNIAQKGIAVRLDSGSGGVSKGNSWLIYDEDTMRCCCLSRGIRRLEGYCFRRFPWHTHFH